MKNKRWMAAALCFMLAGVGPSSAVAQGAEETVDTQPENTAEETTASQAENSTEEIEETTETEEESSADESDDGTNEQSVPDGPDKLQDEEGFSDESHIETDEKSSSDESDIETDEESSSDETDNTEDAESSLDLLKVRSCTAVNNGTEIIITMVTENTEYDTICLAYNEEVCSAECIPAEKQEDGSFLFCFTITGNMAGQIVPYAARNVTGVWYTDQQLFMQLPAVTGPEVSDTKETDIEETGTKETNTEETNTEETGTEDTEAEEASVNESSAGTDMEEQEEEKTSGHGSSRSSGSGNTNRGSGSTHDSEDTESSDAEEDGDDSEGSQESHGSGNPGSGNSRSSGTRSAGSGSRSSSGGKKASGGSSKADSEKTESSSKDGIPADGEYEPDSFSFSGGTGKLQIACDKVTIKNGKAYAVLTFSSGKIIYMKVEGQQYDPVSQTDDSSVYEVPVALNTNYTVIACTTAMSQPHEIEYTLYIGLGQNEADIEENLIQVDNAPEVAGFTYQGTVENEAAELFRIHYYSGNVKVLEVCLSDAEEFSWDKAEEETDPEKSLYGGEVLRYLVVPEGTELPAGLSETMIVIQTPVDTVYTDVESDEWLPEDLTRIEPETTWMDPAVYRTLLAEGADLAVVDGAEAEAAEAALEFGDGCGLLGIPVLLDRSAAEKEEAGSEEWEKVYCLFVNQKTTGDRKPEL